MDFHRPFASFAPPYRLMYFISFHLLSDIPKIRRVSNNLIHRKNIKRDAREQ